MTDRVEVMWGWETEVPSDEMVAAARAEIVAELVKKGWKTRSTATTVVYDLTTVVRQESLINLPTHITIGLSLIDDLCRNRFLPKAEKSAASAAEKVLATAPYHVTIARADAIYSVDNPRWFSGKGEWVKADFPDAEDLAMAVAEAKKVLGR